MRKLLKVSSVAAPIPESDIDTDAIFPARFLLLLNRIGLGQHLFHERRQTEAGQTPFILDQTKYQGSEILVAGPRFGIGSSREHAVWALSDFGIRCIIAPSFGDIFYANCLKNGVLPIRLQDAEHQIIMAASLAGKAIMIDLEAQEISSSETGVIKFEIAEHHKYALLNGLDEITSILSEDGSDITAFEARQKHDAPWLQLSDDQLSSFVRPT